MDAAGRSDYNAVNSTRRGTLMKALQNIAQCARCPLLRRERLCLNRRGKAPEFCPTARGKKITDRARREYAEPAVREFARLSSVQEGAGYAGSDRKPGALHPVKTRIEEIMEFARRMNYSRLGLVFCVGLAREAAAVEQIFASHGFEVVSVVCKVGAVPKEEIGVTDAEKIFSGEFESMCNPIAQALFVNDARVHFNVLLGLCVGHDSLFFKYAQAPTTVLAVKDRVTGHNPLAAVYGRESYFARIKGEGLPKAPAPKESRPKR